MNCSIERQERGDAVVRHASGHGRCGLRGSNGPVNNAVQLFQKEAASSSVRSRACYAHMGRLDDAREVAARLRTLTPDVLDSGTRYRNPEYRELFLSGLRLAAGEAE